MITYFREKSRKNYQKILVDISCDRDNDQVTKQCVMQLLILVGPRRFESAKSIIKRAVKQFESTGKMDDLILHDIKEFNNQRRY